MSRNAAEPVRWFRPEPPREASAAPAAPRATAADARPEPALRLRRVSAAGHLREPIARRVSDVEVRFSDLVRWTEAPAAFVERSLARALYEGHGLARSESGAAPRLDVDVRAFEEVPEAQPVVDKKSGATARRAGLVVIWAALADAKDGAIFERTFSARAPAPGDDPAALAKAIGAAMEIAVGDLASAVEQAVRARR